MRRTDEELAQDLEGERYRNLEVWKEAVRFAGMVYAATKRFPPDEVFGLVSQLRRASVSVASNIAEGSKRSPAEFRKFLQYSLGSLAECDTQFCIAEQQRYFVYGADLRGMIARLMMGIRKLGRSCGA